MVFGRYDMKNDLRWRMLQSIEKCVWELVYELNLRMDFVLFIEKGVWDLGYENTSKGRFFAIFREG